MNTNGTNEQRYNNPNLQLTKSTKSSTAAKNTKIQLLGTIQLDPTPAIKSNNRQNPLQTFSILFYITQCNQYIQGTPFFKDHIKTINVNTNK